MSLPWGESPAQDQNHFGRAKARVLFILFGLALAAGILLPSHGARAAAALVQAQGNFCSNCNSVSVTMTIPIVANDLLVVFGTGCSGECSNDPITISDTRSNAWTKATTYTIFGDGGVIMYYTCAANGGSDTITLSDAGGQDMHIHVHEVSGIAASNCLDQIGMMRNQTSNSAIAVSTSSTVSLCVPIIQFA